MEVVGVAKNRGERQPDYAVKHRLSSSETHSVDSVRDWEWSWRRASGVYRGGGDGGGQVCSRE